MKGKRKYTDEQIVAILQEHQGSVTAREVIRRHGISLDTFNRWKRNYSGVGKAELQRQALVAELPRQARAAPPRLRHRQLSQPSAQVVLGWHARSVLE